MNYAKIEFLSISGVIFSPASGASPPDRPVATFRHEEAVASSFHRRLNFFMTQINVTKNCKKKKIWQKESYKPVAVAVRLHPYVVTCNVILFVAELLKYLLTYLHQ